jgi:hypothetical protein
MSSIGILNPDGAAETDATDNTVNDALGEVTGTESNPAGEAEATLATKEAHQQNKKLADYMFTILADSRQEAIDLRRKLKWTYWIIVALSTLMFLVGLALISAPLWGPLVNNAPDLRLILTATGLGIADFIGLYLLHPLTRLQKLMADMSQLTLLLDSFTIQVALRLIEADSCNRPTMGAAASHVGKTAQGVLDLIDEQFEKWLTKQLSTS